MYWQRQLGGYKWKDNNSLSERCIQSKARVAKVIRLAGDVVETLLNKNPKLQIIYLYRDPRGIINSRLNSRFKEIWKREISSVRSLADGLCRKMQLDADMLFRLKQKYPRRIFSIDYETAAQFPEDTATKVFNFLTLPLPEEYLRTISSMGKSNTKENQKWNSAFRSDGFKTSIKWKTELSAEAIKDIDDVCTEVYQMLGYGIEH